MRIIPAGVELVRLDPGGEYAVREDVLCKVNDGTPRWYPDKEEAVAFIERMHGDGPIKNEVATPSGRHPGRIRVPALFNEPSGLKSGQEPARLELDFGAISLPPLDGNRLVANDQGLRIHWLGHPN